MRILKELNIPWKDFFKKNNNIKKKIFEIFQKNKISRATVVAKIVILSISFLTTFILALRVVLGAELVTFGILSSISFILIFFNNTIFYNIT